ncbi:MAG: hypothetical protein K8T10_14895 [Candidatus Eremiobacteraeota bacterium]|nr:hypothetical protein [Candidatus Eremiobacteraeota bacterium]
MDSIGGINTQHTYTALTPKKEPEKGSQSSDTLVLSGKEELTLIPNKISQAKSSGDIQLAKNAGFSSAIQTVGSLAGLAGSQAIEGTEEPDTLPRPMTESEKMTFERYFPKLDVDKAVVSGEASHKYNCISWTVGETEQWFWPPEMYPDQSEREAFDSFYASYGLKPNDKGEVARWKNNEGLTHGSISGEGHGPRWESKCGSLVRIQHERDELESTTYGWIDGYYAKEKGSIEMNPYTKMQIPENVKKEVAQKANNVDPATRKKFDSLYNKWTEFRKKPDIQFSSNPASHCKTDSFKEITQMGDSAVPLLMEKITKGDFFCLQALKTIKDNSIYKVESNIPTLLPEENKNSEQNKSVITLLKWYEGR